jgi:transglutaminase/protease-like cytokinesis protein 3
MWLSPRLGRGSVAEQENIVTHQYSKSVPPEYERVLVIQQWHLVLFKKQEFTFHCTVNTSVIETAASKYNIQYKCYSHL